MIEDLHKRYGSRVIYDGFSLTIRRGERWAVMGRNGAGKTTLLKMIAGASAPDAGSVRLGASLNMGYFAQQSLDVLDPDLTVIEQLQRDFPQDGLGFASFAGRGVPVLGRRCGQADPRALGRREIAAGDGADALQSAEFPGAGRADQSPGPGDQGDAGGRAQGFRRHHDLRIARPHVPARPRLACAGSWAGKAARSANRASIRGRTSSMSKRSDTRRRGFIPDGTKRILDVGFWMLVEEALRAGVLGFNQNPTSNIQHPPSRCAMLE